MKNTRPPSKKTGARSSNVNLRNPRQAPTKKVGKVATKKVVAYAKKIVKKSAAKKGAAKTAGKPSSRSQLPDRPKSPRQT